MLNKLNKFEKFKLNFDLVEISGNCEKFLQGQISIDLYKLKENQLNLSAFCDAKGRIIVSGWILRLSASRFFFIFAKGGFDLFENLLVKFLPFYKDIKIKNLTGAYALFALDYVHFEQKTNIFVDFKLDNNSFFALNSNNLLLNIEDISTKFLLCKIYKNCENSEKSASFENFQSSKNFEKTDVFDDFLKNTKFLNQAELDLKIAKSSLVLIAKSLSAKYIPQMLNYAKFNAISLNKGCYTGQEVIARLEFRGKIKSYIRLLENIKIDSSFVPKIADKIKTQEIEKTQNKELKEMKEIGELLFVAQSQKGFFLLCLLKQEVFAKNTLIIGGTQIKL